MFSLFAIRTHHDLEENYFFNKKKPDKGPKLDKNFEIFEKIPFFFTQKNPLLTTNSTLSK